MRQPRLLVVTTVHTPDDTRIRERLIPTLTDTFQVSYATKEPGPTDMRGLRWIRLPGGRFMRNVSALLQMMRGGWDALILHDPETIPAGILTAVLLSRPVVFDVHEDLPAQISSKRWAPDWTKGVLRWLSRVLYVMAERYLTLTLAEEGYAGLFRSEHSVFPNYPRSASWPEPSGESNGAIYVGDVTEVRGVGDAITACRAESVPLEIVGSVGAGFKVESDDLVSFTGRLPHREALLRMQTAAVGLSPLRSAPNYVDSLPTKTLEYLAMGLPVVATDLPGSRSVLGELEAVWLVAPGDVDALGRAIGEALKPESGEAARQQAPRIRQRFEWPEQQVVEFYRSLVSL